ncbi:hypothetical protein B7494_g6163 [Chlorociboria aeruginascens]|nr:hypothetical protein B7494_g6163 [Chlorociboria aeruginascens]
MDKDAPPRPKALEMESRTAVPGITASDPAFEVKFQAQDPQNPKNWPKWLRILSIGAFAFTSWSNLLFTTCYANGIPGMMQEFHYHDSTVLSLGLSLPLVGMGIGSLVLAPLSETVGRRPVYIVCQTAFLAFIPLCATARSLIQVLICRFLASLMGTVVLSISPGSIVDIVQPQHLPLAISIYCIGPMNGPVTGPIIGGFTYERWGWRSLNWLVLIISGLGSIIIFLIPESYAPVLLRRRAHKLRQETHNSNWWSAHDSQIPITYIIKRATWRPFKLAFTEPVLWFWNLYISVVYAILYLCFIAYPLIFSGTRKWSPGLSGLAFMGVFIGTSLATICEPLLRKIIAAQPKDRVTGRPLPEASLSVVCIASILAPAGQLIFALTSMPARIPWPGSIIAGVPFGFGNTVIFIYGTYYISSVYGLYASSAMAGNAVCRFVMGAVLVLVGNQMYDSLTPRIAGIVLAGIEFALVPIPFAFYRYGARIREKSSIIREMRSVTEEKSTLASGREQVDRT